MRRINITVLCVVVLALVACSSQSSETSPDPVATTAEELLVKGSPCASTSQCQAGLTCVDTVCCDSPCGGGARDDQSCSNVYGAVAGLVDGHCTALKTNDFCGGLVQENPCQWRGAMLNNGGQCPSPKDGDPIHACYTCTSTACPAAFPVCDANKNCVACTGDFGSTKTASNPSPCPTSGLPACVNGACVACSAGNTSACPGACNTTTNTCVPCDEDFGQTGGTTPCTTPTKPACIGGTCFQCRDATNQPVCDTLPATPHCDSTSHSCVNCTDSSQCLAATPICSGNVCQACASNAGGAAPACPSADPACIGGKCFPCATNPDCVGNPAGPACRSDHQCVQCVTPADCPNPVATPFCISNLCSPGCASNADCAAVPGKTFCDLTIGGVCVECTSVSGNCTAPKPFCVSDVCVQCASSADCPNPTPLCVSGTCQACDSNGSCAAKDPTTPACDATTGACVECTSSLTTACPTGKPFCDNDKCVQCLLSSQCTGATTPVCVSNACVGCANDSGGAAPACPDPTLPVCLGATGQCVACHTPDLKGCTDPGKPVCNDAVDQCVECTANAQCTGIDGLCDLGSHTCTLGCSSDANCVAPTPKCNLATSQCVQCVDFTTCSQPTPVCNGATHTCVECIIDAQCSGTTPFCQSGVCVGCNGNLGSNAIHACTQPTAPACLTTGPGAGMCVECTATDTDACVSPKPACSATTNKCVQCSSSAQCSGATPICNAAGSCVACDGDLGTGSPAACLATSAPACVKTGADAGRCVQCTTADPTLCVGAAPVCDDTAHVCVACLDNTQCTGANGLCNTTSHTCTVGCTSDANCSGSQPVCELPEGLCVACTAAEPGACAGTTALCKVGTDTCVQCLATTDCPAATPVCNPATNTCQAACSADADCPTSVPICSPTTKRCVQCAASSDCRSASAPICDTTTGTCGTECSKSAECPGAAPICNPTTKQCVQCQSDSNCPTDAPTCDVTVGTCSAQCTTSSECPGQTPVCDQTAKKCVQCTGDSNCPADTPVCNKTSGSCTATCVANVDCPGAIPVCNPTTKQCVQCTDNSTCPASAPICNTATNKCGGAPAPAPAAPAASPPPDVFSVEGAGCACSTAPSSLPSAPALLVGLAGALTAVLRRRRRAA